MTAADRSDEADRGEGDDRDGGADRGDGPDNDSGLGHLLERVRTEPRAHWPAVAVAMTAGLALARLHWFGLVLAGALVGLVSPTVRRGIVGAVGFGVLVLAAFAIGLGDAAWRVLEMTPIVYVAVAGALGLPAFGSLVRGVL